MSFTPKDRFLSSKFADVGEGADIDEAFEDAVDTARVEFGLSGVIPSIASLGASDINVISEHPLPLSRQMILLSREEIEENKANARAVALDSQFKRRRSVLKIEDELDLDVLRKDGQLPLELEQELLKRLVDAGVEVTPEEFIEKVEVTSYRARYKPLVIVNRGRNKNTFVVKLEGDDKIRATGSTPGEARREAVRLAKEGEMDEKELYSLVVEVSAVRDDGSPLFKIVRERLSQKASVKVTLAQPKNSQVKTTSWVFYSQLK